MLEFLVAAAVVFVACWVWIGGYLADFVVWLVSKLTPSSSNETNLAFVLAGIFFVLGVVVAMNTEGKAGSTLGGAVAGAGLYIAVRLPGKIRNQRAARATTTELGTDVVPSPAASTPGWAQAPNEPLAPSVGGPGVLAPASPQPAELPVAGHDARATAWAEVHDPATSPARLAAIAAEHPEFGSAIDVHPNVYPELRAWIGQHATSAPDR